MARRPLPDGKARTEVARRWLERPTIFSVAEAASVSITTVSHVFSGKRRVNEETRRRVLATAEKLSYRPRASALALATGRTMTLALQVSVVGDELVLNPFFGSLLAGMSLAALDRGYSFLFIPPDPPEDLLEPLFREPRIDGAVVVDPRGEDRFVRTLLEREIPFASIGRLADPPNEHWVDNDHARVCAHVINHLRQRGYARLVLMTVPYDISYVSDYLNSFEKVAGRSDGTVIANNLSEPAAFEAALQFLPDLKPPAALFCIHDRLAIGALRAAAQLGIDVPGELGIVGVGDSVLASHAQPPLTSVRVFPDRAGVEVVGLIDRLIRELSDSVAPIVIPARLVPRASTGRSL